MANSTLRNPFLQRLALLSVHTSPLAPLGGDKTGGMNVYVREFSRELARQEVQVDIFTRATDANQPLVDQSIGAGVRVIHVMAGPPRAISVDEIANHLPEFADGVLQFAAAEKLSYDLIYSHYWLSGLVAEQLRRRWMGVPIVHMFHTLGHMKNKVAQTERERASQERLNGEQRVMQIADRLIAPTEAERSQLIELYGADPQKIAVIPPGVDLSRFRRMGKEQARSSVDLPAERTHIVFTGRIEPLKGIDTLLRATALLRQRRPEVAANAKVTIIGGDPAAVERDTELARLYDLRCSLNLCDLVGFVGAKDQDLLPYYFAAADMVVMPSHYESFGMVALEAMASGTPVVASEVGGLAHLVHHGKTGLTFPAQDPEALAARIDELLADANLRRHLGLQASAHARQYRWPAIVRRLVEEVFCPLVERRCTDPLG
ncbi:MAG: glycosyltransferase family 1 protein [Chloroflexi bacterium]|nr:MAG: glycosyltransferase family 1 protein [Chloroflexota bacterium]